ncbi:AMP-binding protein [Streptomyces cinereospinus]|uniref:AMP-binding protein n=1 Tax=Streptomyces cinereospinus TaxID=285561 RepID=A0ABV5MXF7_9ACTN
MLLDWLREPSEERGMYFAGGAGDWAFRSYADLAAEVRRIGAGLLQSGIRPGSIVSLIVTDPAEFVVSFMGVLAAGSSPAPLAGPAALRGLDRYTGHLARVFGIARPAAVLADAELAELVRAGLDAARQPVPTLTPAGLTASATDFAPVLRGPDELALLQFTSGSTGHPKGVWVTWSGFAANLAAIRGWLRWTERDAFASWLPLHHDMGLVGGMMMPLVTGTDSRLMTPAQFVRHPLRWVECFGRHGATLTTAPSFGYAYAARRLTPERLAGLDFSGWRVAIVGAERIDPVAAADFTALTAPHGFDHRTFVAAYGLAENTVVATGVPVRTGSRVVRVRSTALPVGERVEVDERGVLGVDRVGGGGWLTGCGTAVPGTTATVVDQRGAPLPPGTFGEIALTGTSLSRGYLRGPEQLDTFGAGGLRTGDAGFEYDGELFVVGRIGESMKIRGAHVHAEDVEAELAQHEEHAVSPCAVAFASLDDGDHCVVFVEGRVDAGWAERAARTVKALTHGAVRISVVQGARGAVARTSSGKPRRAVMWNEVLAPDPERPKWTAVHGTPPSVSRRTTAGAAE